MGEGNVAPSQQAAADAKTQGSWQLLPFHSSVLAIHTAVLHTGKVLFFAGSGNSRTRFESPRFGDEAHHIWTSAVWNPAAGAGGFAHPHTLRNAAGRPVDFFCCGHTFLPDGRVLAAGGTVSWHGNADGLPGLRDVLAFDPQTQQWSARAYMVHGRWYPTLITLGDGRILITSGLRGNLATNTRIETYSSADNTWQALQSPQPPHFAGLPRYAHLLLLESGAVFFTGGRMDDPSAVGPCLVDVAADPVTIRPVAGLQDGNARDQSTSVLLPPAQDQRVMIMGGAPVGPHATAVRHCDIVDFKAPGTPAYHAAASMHRPRIHLNAVLLPDRTVLVAGGARGREDRAHPTPEVEIYDPASNTWTLGAASRVTRLYHSVAVLLPDARVLAAGGNPPPFGHQVRWEPPDHNEEMRLDVYSPPYLFKGPRPVIQSAPTEWAYGQTVAIQTPAAGSVKWASLVRSGVATHSFNTNQRLVDLPIASQSGGVVEVEVTREPNIAPPGWYMLFLVDDQGIPSVAKWIHLQAAPANPSPSAYEQAVLATPGLVGYWRLDEPAGTVAFDVLGRNHASYTARPPRNAAGPITGEMAVALDGQHQYVLLPRLVRNDFTLELWFRAEAGGVGAGTQWWQASGLVDGEVPGVRDDFGVSLDSAGRVWAGTGHPDTSIHSGPGLADGAWHHVAFTRVRGSGQLTLYVDGSAVASGHGGTQPLTSPPALRAGVLQSGAHPLAADLAHLATYSAALPASTVALHVQART
jgi:Domain of unknown function (DUF1929)/Concanavalin A-like lectin/glucanases superfamily